MRILTALVILAAMLWGGWWFVGSRAETRAVKAFFAAQQAGGRLAEYSSLGVEGFPNRFDLTVNDIALGDRAAGVTWRAPFAQLLALSYNPYHYIAALPHRQELQTPDGDFTLTSSKMEASLKLAPGLAFALKEFIAVVNDPALSSSLGWKVAAKSLRVATRRLPGRKTAQEIGIAADRITPGDGLKALLDPAGKLPATLSQAYVDAEAGFDAPIDRHLGRRPPHLTDLRVKDAHLNWGPMLLSARGKLTIGADGVPEGRIMLKAKDWRGMVGIAVGLGLIRPEMAPTVTNMLAELAKTSPDPGTVELPLAFQSGRMSFGPLPLGPAPQLR
jgi:hypothetical protein